MIVTQKATPLLANKPYYHVSRADKKYNTNENELKKTRTSDFIKKSFRSYSRNRLENVPTRSTLKNKFSIFCNTGIKKYSENVKMMPKNAVTRTSSGSSLWTTSEIARKLSWGQILQHRTTNRTVFDNCDPYKTLHFLVEELCTKIHCTPGTNSVFVDKIIKNIREIMLRIPESLSRPNESGDKKPKIKQLRKKLLSDAKETEKENRAVQTTYIPKKPKPLVDSKLTQTSDPRAENKYKNHNKMSQTHVPSKVFSSQAYILDKEIEQKIKILNERCHALELQINALTTERNNYKNLYEKQLEHVLSLEFELGTNEEIFREEKSKFLEEICILVKENDDLKRNIKKFDELEIQNKILEKDLEAAQRETIRAQLNFEKVSVLIQSRDKQLDELHQEFCNIQNVVTAQMAEVYTQADLPHYTTIDLPKQNLEISSATVSNRRNLKEDSNNSKTNQSDNSVNADNLTISSRPQTSHSETQSNISLSLSSHEDANLNSTANHVNLECSNDYLNTETKDINVQQNNVMYKKPGKTKINLKDKKIFKNFRDDTKFGNLKENENNNENELIKNGAKKFKLVNYVESNEQLQPERKISSPLLNKIEVKGDEEKLTKFYKNMDPEVVKYDALINKILKFVRNKSKNAKREKIDTVDDV